MFVCKCMRVCVCVCICTALAARGHSLWAVGCRLWTVGGGRLGCWSVLQKFSTTRLFSIFPQRADAVCCCCCARAASSFCRRSFWHRAFSLSSFHACSLTLLLSMLLFCCTCVRIHTNIRTYVGAHGACVLEFALHNLLFKQFAIFNYFGFYCIHSDI